LLETKKIAKIFSRMDVSIIITTNREPKTLLKALFRVRKNLAEKFWQALQTEVLVIGPDQETKKTYLYFKNKANLSQNIKLRLLKDRGIGKPNALNWTVKQAKGKILVLTDGDVYVEPGAIQNLVKTLKKQPKIGAVSGRPVSLNPKNNLFGFWSHYLVEQAHSLRLRRLKLKQYLPVSGYLFAIKKNLFPALTPNLLAEDAWLSLRLHQRGYKISYCHAAWVYVKFPTNWTDWLKQKKRSVGGYWQTNYKQNRLQLELAGLKSTLTYPSNSQERWWMFLLILARIYLWILIWWEIKVLKKSAWKRVESTK